MSKKSGEDDDISETLAALGWEEEKEPSAQTGESRETEESNEPVDASEVLRLREKLTELQQTVTSTSSRVETLQIQLQQATEDLRVQLSTNASLENKIEQLTNELEVARAREAPDDLEDQITSRDQRIHQLEDSLNEIQSSFHDIQDQLDEKGGQIAALSNYNASIEEQLQNQVDPARVSQLEQDIELKEGMISEKSNEIGVLKETIEELRNDFDQLQSGLEVKDQKIATLEEELKNSIEPEQVDQLEAATKQKDEIIRLKDDEIIDLEGTVENLRNELSQAIQLGEVKDQAIANLEASLGEQKINFQNETEELRRSASEKSDQLVETEQEFNALTSELENLQVESSKWSLRTGELEEHLIALEEENVNLKQRVDEIQAEYYQKLEDMSGFIEQKEGRIAELRDAIEIKVRETETLKDKVPSVTFLKEKVDQQQFTIQQQDERIRLLEDKVQLKVEIIETLTREKEVLTKAADLHENQLVDLNQTLTSSETENIDLREQIQQWEQEGTHRQFESDKQAKQMAEGVERWKGKFEESESAQEQMVNEVMNLKDEVRVLNDQVKIKADEEIELRKKIKILRRDLEKLKGG